MQSCGILDVSGPNILQHLGWASVMAISSSTRLRPLLIPFVFPQLYGWDYPPQGKHCVSKGQTGGSAEPRFNFQLYHFSNVIAI